MILAAPFRGTKENTACPFGATRAQDQLRFVGGETDLHGDGSSLVVGQWRSSSACAHVASLAGYRNFGKLLDGVTSEGHNKDMNTAAELVDGELRGGTITRHALPCDVFGVEAMEQTRKGATCLLTERLYVCANGFRVGARRGGRLHLADKKTWEVFVMDQRGISTGNSVGWVTDAALLAAVQKLASWFDEPETFWLAS